MAFVSCHLFLCLLLFCSFIELINGGNPPPRKKVAVEGVINCNRCFYDPNFQLVLTVTPIHGAAVKLQCNNTGKSWEEQAKTDEKGRFSMKPGRVSSWGVHKCKLFLVSSPISDCTSPGRNYPDPDSARWLFGSRLAPVAAANNASSPFQYYESHFPLKFYDDSLLCIP